MCISKERFWPVKFRHSNCVMHISKRGSWSPPAQLTPHQREWFTEPPIKSYLWSTSASLESDWPGQCMTVAAGTEQTLTEKDREGVMLGLWLFRSMKLKGRNCTRERHGEKSWAEAGLKLLHNCWMKLKSMCIKYSLAHFIQLLTHIPLSSSFILTSWAHLSFSSRNHCGLQDPTVRHTHKITPNFRHGSWGLMSRSRTDIHLDRAVYWQESGIMIPITIQPLGFNILRYCIV